jgi:hypothetical protein
MLRDQNSSVQPKAFTQRSLPQSYRVRVNYRRELVIEKDFRGTNGISLYAVFMVIDND